MRTHILRGVGLLAATALATAALVTPAEAGGRGQPKPYCVSVTADGVGQDLGGGVTEATLSVGGRTIGTTRAAFTLGTISGTAAPFTGPLVFTPNRVPGTLTAQLTGAFDVTTGVFTATSTSVTGTRALRGVTGAITIRGTENFADGTSTETISGELCVAHGHRRALQRAVVG